MEGQSFCFRFCTSVLFEDTFTLFLNIFCSLSLLWRLSFALRWSERKFVCLYCSWTRKVWNIDKLILQRGTWNCSQWVIMSNSPFRKLTWKITMGFVEICLRMLFGALGYATGCGNCLFHLLLRFSFIVFTSLGISKPIILWKAWMVFMLYSPDNSWSWPYDSAIIFLIIFTLVNNIQSFLWPFH